MIGWRVRKQPIIALYFESDTVLRFYNLDVRSSEMWEQIIFPGLKNTKILV